MLHRFHKSIPAVVALCLLLSAAPAAQAAEAESGTVLAYLIELYRKQNKPCGDRTMPQPPALTYSVPLREAARELAMGGGRDLQAILAAQNLKASHFHTFTAGEAKAEDAMARLKADHCVALLEPYTHIGAVRENERWWVVMATLASLPAQTDGNATAPAMNSAQPAPGASGAAQGAVPGTPVLGGATGPATAAPVPAPQSAAPAAKARPVVQSPDAKAISARINAIRANGVSCGGKHKAPAPALASSPALVRAAQGHAVDMATKGYFGATSPDGVTLENRVHTENYAWSLVTELISKGPPPASAVVDLWLSTPSQCEQIMDPSFSEMGVGMSGEYWTLILGKPTAGVPSLER